MVATADQTARRAGSSAKPRRARMPTKAKTRIAMVLSRGSQAHQTPQVGLAQMLPCRQSSAPSTTPTSMPASR